MTTTAGPATGAVPLVRAAGTPRELGLAHGQARAAELRAFVDDGLCRMNRLLRRPVSMADLAPRLDAYGAAVASAVPELAAEIEGLAEGAGLTRPEALLLQTRRELMGYLRVPTAGDCTTYARTGAGEPVLAQTVDLAGNLDDVVAVLDVSPAPGTGRLRSLVLSFGGLLGYLGLNEARLAIGINLVLGGEWGPGVPPYLAVRHLLDHARGVEEALALLARLPVAGSRSLTLCDAEVTACVEIVDGDLRVARGDRSVHTNHFLDPAFVPRDELNVFARNSSLRRLDAGRAGLAELAPDARAEEHFALLTRRPIRVADHGDPRTERTVAAVVMLPERGELHVRRGDPALSATRVFSLGGAR